MPLLPLLLLAAGAKGDLAPGDPAPPFMVRQWVKGAPVTTIEKGKTYVVEFWATWCGPCRQTIPHLTALAKANPDVTVLGVSVWEPGGPSIKSFVDKMGPRMDYHVGWSGEQDGMAKSWMAAAGQHGIPTAFVVKEGKIVWIGHPMELGNVLPSIQDGTFDLQAFKENFGRLELAVRARTELDAGVQAADDRYRKGDRAGARAALDALLKRNPDLEPEIKRTRLRWLATESLPMWQKEARALATSDRLADMEALVGFAVDMAAKPVTVPLARRAAALALQADPRGFDALRGSAQVYESIGDYAQALDLTKKLMLYYPTGQTGVEPEFGAALRKEKARLTGLLKKGAASKV